MENFNHLKRERDQLRRNFNKTCEELKIMLKDKLAKKEDITACLNQLEDKGDRLFALDEKIRDAIFSVSGGFQDEEFEEEFETVEAYRDQLIKYKSEGYYFLNERKATNVSSSSSTGGANSKRHFRLPQLELKKFDGDVKNWIGFWGQFKKIDEDKDIDKEDKFQYLIQATVVGSAARELVESFPPSGENYDKAIKQLKTRFARDEFLIEVYVRELLNLVLKQSLKNQKSMSLSNLFDKLETQLRALESLGVTGDKYAAMLHPLVESALPEDTLKVWERYRTSTVKKQINEQGQGDEGENKCTNHLNLLLDFLKTEVESEERINLARTSFGQEKGMQKNFKQGKEDETEKTKLYSTSKMKEQNELYTAATIFTSNEKFGKKTQNCLFCDKSHSSQDCMGAQKLTFEEKKDRILKKNCCFGCLKPNHNIKKCRNFIKCLICSKKHFPIMCPDLQIMNKRTENKSSSDGRELVSGDIGNVLTSNNINSNTDTLLQTIIVRLGNNNNNKVRIVRALLDSASQRSYLLTKHITEMGFTKIGEETIIQGVFGGSESSPQIHGVYDISVQSLDNSFQFNATILNQDKICNYVPRLQNSKYIEFLNNKNVEIVDVGNKICEISLLLGADLIGQLFTGTIEKVDDNIVAFETRLGWTIMGKQVSNSNLVTTFSCLSQSTISELWSLDTLGIKDPIEVKNKNMIQTEVMDHFKATISTNIDGRYEVCLPWVEGHPELHNNFNLSVKRLNNITKILTASNIFSDYEKIFQEWLHLGIIEEVIEDELEKHVYYLPHHPVIKESSVSTKIRPVFDASSEDIKGHSLNDCLEKGPNLIELIPFILLQFRLRSIGVSADIKKAFLQISLSKEDRNFLRFLWWKDNTYTSLRTFRHCRVVFGVSSSPFLLAATILLHLEKVAPEFRETAEKMKTSFYVDNCVTSVDSMSELQKFIIESKQIMSEAQFDLRGWIHSFGEANSDVTCNENITPLLGLSWNFKSDTLFCDVDSLIKLENISLTKRGLLSVAQRVFDPVGFTCPVTLIPKILLRQTWKIKLGWDKELPDDIIKEFKKWLQQISWLNFCKIPRSLCTFPLKNALSTSLHVFCDASKLAYATCIFIRAQLGKMVSVQLIEAKSRISPIKIVTLPRLELLAAVIGARLCQSMKKLDILNTIKTYFWTDSMVVLAWIKTKENWTTFVGNRVREICTVSNPEDWYHVPGNLNPADLPSRGCNAKKLMESNWWQGPEWLRNEPEFWPHSEINYSDAEIYAEKRKTIISIVAHEKVRMSENFNKFSSYSRIIRMIGWILRFISNLKNKRKMILGELKCEEIEESETRLLKIIQQESFGSIELDLIHNLKVFEDNRGILRIKTKLISLEDINDFKFPILLPSNHEIVNRLIFEQHRLKQHAGITTLLSILRNRFWILKGRKTVRQVLSKCLICKRHNQKAVETPFAPLPENRIKEASAFEVSGVDYAGPLYLKGGGKAWIVLFTCAVYRAVHFELVTSLSTDAFILALRRFIARRGRISTIYSDNGTCFVGANNFLNKIDWNEIIKYSSVQRIRWIFNAPTAPWWGGWWERLIRTTKELLRRNLGKACVTYEELMTILCDCESVVNSRPITYFCENDELMPLTPAHFLQNIQSNQVPDLDMIDRNYLLRRHRFLQTIRDNLRKRFKREYLGNLVHFGKRRISTVEVGDIVLVGADNMKRTNWPLARVLELYQGKDKVERVARIKVAGAGELVRPLQRLYPLEISCRDSFSPFSKTDPNISNNSNNNQMSQLPDQDSILMKKTGEKKSGSSSRETTVTRSGRVVKIPERFEP